MFGSILAPLTKKGWARKLRIINTVTKEIITTSDISQTDDQNFLKENILLTNYGGLEKKMQSCSPPACGRRKFPIINFQFPINLPYLPAGRNETIIKTV